MTRRRSPSPSTTIKGNRRKIGAHKKPARGSTRRNVKMQTARVRATMTSESTLVGVYERRRFLTGPTSRRLAGRHQRRRARDGAFISNDCAFCSHSRLAAVSPFRRLVVVRANDRLLLGGHAYYRAPILSRRRPACTRRSPCSVEPCCERANTVQRRGDRRARA